MLRYVKNYLENAKKLNSCLGVEIVKYIFKKYNVQIIYKSKAATHFLLYYYYYYIIFLFKIFLKTNSAFCYKF